MKNKFILVFLVTGIIALCSCGSTIDRKVNTTTTITSYNEPAEVSSTSTKKVDSDILNGAKTLSKKKKLENTKITEETKKETKKHTETKAETTTTAATYTEVYTYPSAPGAAATVETEKVYIEQETTTSQIEEYVVYKPSSHYIHRSTCHWVTNDCYKISNTKDIKARKCTECNPDMEIVNEYKEITTTTATTAATPKETTSNISPEEIDSYSRQLLAEIVWHEYGSDWVSTYEKARIAAGVMNRVRDPRFPNTVYNVLTQKGQFTGYWPGCCTPTQACYDAVDYYFAHQGEFGNENSWYGDGYRNYFYYQ